MILRRCGGAGQQLVEIEVDAGHRPVGFLGEWAAHVEGSLVQFALHQYDGQDELVLLVEAVEDFVAGDRDGGLPLGAALIDYPSVCSATRLASAGRSLWSSHAE